MGLNGWLENDIGARRRTWLRGHLPAWAGRFFPKVENCYAHFWYTATRSELHCYHCEQTKPWDGKIPAKKVLLRGRPTTIRDRTNSQNLLREIREGIRQDKRMADPDEGDTDTGS